MEIQKEISFNNNAKKVGKEMKVLIDDEDESFFFARSEFDAPEIDNMVLIKKNSNKKIKIGEFINVKIIDNSDYDLYAEIKEN